MKYEIGVEFVSGRDKIDLSRLPEHTGVILSMEDEHGVVFPVFANHDTDYAQIVAVLSKSSGGDVEGRGGSRLRGHGPDPAALS